MINDANQTGALMTPIRIVHVLPRQYVSPDGRTEQHELFNAEAKAENANRQRRHRETALLLQTTKIQLIYY